MDGLHWRAQIGSTALLRDNVVKYTVGLFIFTLLFALSAQNRLKSPIGDRQIPRL
jgi:hypothetical protein